jgi:hypothetical protein
MFHHAHIEYLPSPFADGRVPPRELPPGPFAPPADYTFEPEFQELVPRPIPEETRMGRHARITAGVKLVCISLASVLLSLAMLPQTKDWAVYVIPCGYLKWIGLLFLATWGVAVMWGMIERFAGLGPYRYIRSGTPVIARVLALVKSPTRMVNGSTVNYAVFALFEFQDPESGELHRSEGKSWEFHTLECNSYTTSFRVGDYVTAVYLPTHFADSLNLYPFLDLMPDVGLIHRQAPGTSRPWINVRMLICLMALPLAGAVAAFTYSLYVPLDFGFWQSAPLFAVCFVSLAIVWLTTLSSYRLRRHEWIVTMNALAREEAEPFEVEAPPPAGCAGGFYKWVLLPLAFSAIGGSAILYSIYAVNALCDRSAPRLQKVQIVGLAVREHHGIFRTYTIEYMVPWSPRVCRLCTSPDNMASFERAAVRTGIAELHRGFLGWTWVNTIRPDIPAPPGN